jgi:SAM-dependent methyltransferase
MCGASTITMSMISVLKKRVPDLKEKSVYELSSRGPLFKFLCKHANRVTFSEFFDDVACGAVKGGILCQDVESLTFEDGSFDLCTSTEVFEHVPNDIQGFSEICRVLKPNGIFVFTVPLHDIPKTVERVKKQLDGSVELLSPAQYHGDHLRGSCGVLTYRNYGPDIIDRLFQSGFRKAVIDRPSEPIPFGFSSPVIVAYK